MMHLDVAIIGGGPAGVAAGLSLRQLMPDAEIAIFDAGTEHKWRPGECLSPGATSILQSLSCWDAFLANNFLESFGTKAAWGSPEPHENEFLFSLHGNGWRLDRSRFDAMMLECVRAVSIVVRNNTRLVCSSGDHAGWHLQFPDFECDAKFVIDASGRAATFALQRGSRAVVADRLAGVFVLYETESEDDTFIEAAETGWWYSTTVPGSTAVVAFMTDTDLIRGLQLHCAEQWHKLLTCSTHTRHRLEGATAKSSPAVFVAYSQHLSQMGGLGWITAGDTTMTFDPLSSQGILKALRSGKLASFVAADFLCKGIDSHQKYEKIARAEYCAYEKVKREYYGKEQRWPQAPFWTRRH